MSEKKWWTGILNHKEEDAQTEIGLLRFQKRCISNIEVN